MYNTRITRGGNHLASRITASDVDPRRALAQLGYADVGEPVALTGGWETLMWRFATPDGAEHALRIYRVDDAEQIARRERVAMETCAAGGVPTTLVEAAGTYDGLPAIVQTWCPGVALMSALEQRPWQVVRLSRMFGALHARLHTVRAPAELAATAPVDWLSRVLPEHQHLAERLARVSSTGTLVHLDYNPMNVILDGTRTSIIDWSYSAAGDVRADLATTAVTFEAAPIPPGPLRPILNFMRRLALRGWRAGYEGAAGPMPDYRLYRAWACAMMLRGTIDSMGRPGVWATEHDLAVLRQRIERWSAET